MSYWSDIVEKHGPDVWRTCYRLLNHAEDASDCYQETFLRAVEYERSNSVTCWPAVLRRIATARAMDLLRHRYRTKAVSSSLPALTDETACDELLPHAQIELRESMEQLRHALTEIPARQAEVFWLSEVELLSHPDIADQLGTTSKQVGLWLHRGKQKLRKLLAERGVTKEVRR